MFHRSQLDRFPNIGYYKNKEWDLNSLYNLLGSLNRRNKDFGKLQSSFKWELLKTSYDRRCWMMIDRFQMDSLPNIYYYKEKEYRQDMLCIMLKTLSILHSLKNNL